MAILHHYPSEILKDEYKFRSIKIIVKESKIMNGGVDELKTQIVKSYDDTMKVLKSTRDGNIDARGVNPANSINDIKHAAKQTKKLSKAETIYGLALPLPNELNDSQSHQWETKEGFVGSVVGGLANTEIGIGSIKGSVNSALGELSSASGSRKPLIDPGYFQDYKGTEPRQFTFSWDLIPDSAEDADNILLILYNLKKYTLPSSSVNGISLTSPFLFELIIGNPNISDMMNMNNVVCTSMNINYSAEGALQFFDDGMLKYIKLEMSFSERSTVTSNFF